MTAAHSPYTVYCVALTLDGYRRATVAAGIAQTYIRTRIDGTTETMNGGCSRVSVAQTSTIASGSSGSTVCTVASVPGAVAYAWFWGASGADVKLGAITTVNTYTITTDVAAGTQTYATLNNANDYSQDSYVFDGILSQVAKTSSGAYIVSLDGAVLTAGGDGSLLEFDVALQSFWENYRLSPTDIWVSSQEKKNIKKKIVTGSTSMMQRFVFNSEQGKLTGGSMAISYLNPFTMSDAAEEIPIRLHPDIPAGTVLFTTDQLPYPLSNVSNVVQMKLRRDYYSIEWPLRSRKYEYGVYFDGVLQNYFPPAFGVIQNIGNG